jgi:hypothetical protein
MEAMLNYSKKHVVDPDWLQNRKYESGSGLQRFYDPKFVTFYRRKKILIYRT